MFSTSLDDFLLVKYAKSEENTFPFVLVLFKKKKKKVKSTSAVIITIHLLQQTLWAPDPTAS